MGGPYLIMKHHLISLCTFLSFALGASAQDLSGTKMDDRIGHGQDSLEVRQNMSLYMQYFKQQDYTEALEPWEIVFRKAPLSLIRVYTDGAWMYEQLIAKETDLEKKNEYFEKLMLIYNKRLENLDALNSFATPKTTSTKGNILCRQGWDYYYYCPEMDIEKAYKMFRSGIDDMGPNTEAFVLYGFIECSYNRYMADKENGEKRTEFVRDFLECNDICDNLLDQAKEFAETDSVKAMQVVNAYLPTKDKCNELFIQSEAADCEILERIYSVEIENHKEDLEYLDAVLKVLEWFGCKGSDTYFKTSDYVYAIHPTPRAAIAKANRLIEQKDEKGALRYMEEAIELEKSDKMKARYAHSIAKLYFEKKQYLKAHQWCKKSYGFDPTYGWAYLYDASCISRVPTTNQLDRSKQFNLAYDKIMRAKAVDPACTEAVNKVAWGYRENWYPRSEAFFKNLKEGVTITVLGEQTVLRFK